jgi:hypothetical protein
MSFSFISSSSLPRRSPMLACFLGVDERAKTASWLNKKGMNVTKSKFASDAESQGIDVDDPLFWQKVMPDFVTPEILLRKLDEMEEAFD